VLGILVNGTASFTSGINTVQVTGIQLTYPLGADAPSMKAPVVYAGVSEVMTADEIATHCYVTLPGKSAAGADSVAQGRIAALPPKEHFKINVCRHTGKTAKSPLECVRRTVVGRQAPPDRDKVTAKLVRAGTIYAAERNRKGGIKLIQRRAITPGRYLLEIREKPRRIVVRHNGTGRRLHWAKQEQIVRVPLTIKWNRHK
jgi:hypothetical protein